MLLDLEALAKTCWVDIDAPLAAFLSLNATPAAAAPAAAPAPAPVFGDGNGNGEDKNENGSSGEGNGSDVSASIIERSSSSFPPPYMAALGEHPLLDRPAALASISSALIRMAGFVDESSSSLLTGLSELLRDWAVGKNLTFVMESKLDKARKQEKDKGDKRAADLEKELSGLKRKYDVMKAEKGKTDKRSDKVLTN